jgi:hypothetical protein
VLAQMNRGPEGVEKTRPEAFDLSDRRERWETVTRAKLIAFSAGVGIFFLIILKSEPGFFPILDFANLLFHEAGHPIYGMLHSQLAVYGGTFGQLTFPIVLMVSFWRKGQAISFAIAWIWLFENFLNIARYMADARELALPLIGSGDHDWNEIFMRWDALSYDTTIAAVTRVIGWIGMSSAILWVAYRVSRDSKRT